MATTVDEIIAAPRLFLEHTRTATRTSIAAQPFSVFDLAGSPGAGVLAGTSTTAGVVPTDATAGCPPIDAFSGPVGNIEVVQCISSVAGSFHLCDMLWKAGPYPFNANVSLTGQPAFTQRIPSDDYHTQLWIECVTAFTGNLSINVGYTNQADVAGRSTGVVATGVAPTLGRMIRLPLQSGTNDVGVRLVNSVAATVATVGTFNVLVLRRLAAVRINQANVLETHDFTKTGRRRIYTDSALVSVAQPDSTSTGVISWLLLTTNS